MRVKTNLALMSVTSFLIFSELLEAYKDPYAFKSSDIDEKSVLVTVL